MYSMLSVVNGISEIVKFETFGVADLKQIFDSLSEIPFTTESIEYIHTKYNRFRQIVQLINQLETYAKDNGITQYSLETIRGLI